MDSDDEELRQQQEYEEQMFQTFRVTGTAMMDQYEAHVKDLLRMLNEHRPHCLIHKNHDSEMCVGLSLTEAVEMMSPFVLKRALVMALVMMAREE